MKLSRKCSIALMVPVFGLFLFHIPVYAEESSWPVVYTGRGGEITSLTDVGNMEIYEVKQGDTLWGIAKEKMGSGSSYGELAEANRDLIANPNLIFPGMVLRIPAGGVRLKGDEPYNSMGDYRFAFPVGWTVGYLSVEEAYANFNLSGQGIEHIACLIQDRDSAMVQSTKDWEKCCEKIQNYVKAEYPDVVSDLAFHHYQTEDGEEVYLYSYTYEIDLEEYYGIEGYGYYPVNVCMGIHLTEHMQAQFLGFSGDAEIQNQVLYAAGTFQEIEKPKKPLSETSNMAIEPVYSWELSGMFNPFPWVEQFYDELWRALLNISKEQTIKEKFLER